MIKTLHNLGIEGNFLNQIMGICGEPPQLTWYLTEKDWKLSLKIRNETRMATLTNSI
jgi:hypothetical protein